MRTLTLKCTIASTLVPFIDLQGQHVPLGQNGTTWSGSGPVVLEDTLNIAATVNGIIDSDWSVDVTMDCAGGVAAKIFSRSGSIPQGGSEGFKTSVNVPADPCAPKGQATASVSETVVVAATVTQIASATQSSTAGRRAKTVVKGA